MGSGGKRQGAGRPKKENALTGRISIKCEPHLEAGWKQLPKSKGLKIRAFVQQLINEQ